MPETNFDQICDQLSFIVDQDLFERLRWERTEAPMLARLVALSQAAIEQRSEYELAEEGSTKDTKRYTLKVHSFRVAALAIGLEGSRAVLSIEPVQRSRFRVTSGSPLVAEFQVVDEQWMASALAELFGRVQA